MIVAVIDSTQVIQPHSHKNTLYCIVFFSFNPPISLTPSISLCFLFFQLQELMCHVMIGNLVMFRKDSVLNILSESRITSDTHTLVYWHTHPDLKTQTHSACVSLYEILFTVQSLDWETFEQYSTWQLFLAHSIPLETIIPILQHLKYKGETHTMA